MGQFASRQGQGEQGRVRPGGVRAAAAEKTVWLTFWKAENPLEGLGLEEAMFTFSDDEDLRSWLKSNDVTGFLLLKDDGSGLADPDPDGRLLCHVSDLVSGKHYYAVPLDDGRLYSRSSHSYEPRKLGTNVGDGADKPVNDGQCAVGAPPSTGPNLYPAFMAQFANPTTVMPKVPAAVDKRVWVVLPPEEFDIPSKELRQKYWELGLEEIRLTFGYDQNLQEWLESNSLAGLLLLQEDGSGPASLAIVRRVCELVHGKRYYGLPSRGGGLNCVRYAGERDTAYIYELTKEKQPEAPTPPATGQDTADPTTVTPKNEQECLVQEPSVLDRARQQMLGTYAKLAKRLGGMRAVPEKTVCVVFPDAPPWKGRELEASFTFTSDEDVYSFLASCAFLGLVLVRDDGTGPANMKALRRLSELVDGKRYYGLSRDGNWDLRKLRPIVQGTSDEDKQVKEVQCVVGAPPTAGRCLYPAFMVELADPITVMPKVIEVCCNKDAFHMQRGRGCIVPAAAYRTTPSICKPLHKMRMPAMFKF